MRACWLARVFPMSHVTNDLLRSGICVPTSCCSFDDCVTGSFHGGRCSSGCDITSGVVVVFS